MQVVLVLIGSVTNGCIGWDYRRIIGLKARIIWSRGKSGMLKRQHFMGVTNEHDTYPVLKPAGDKKIFRSQLLISVVEGTSVLKKKDSVLKKIFDADYRIRFFIRPF